MSSVLIPQKIIDDYQNGFYECPYCRGSLPLETHELLDPGPCAHCGKVILMPHKVGSFWLFQQIGKGAMGCVCKAFHETHQRSIYAVKILNRKEKGNERLIRALQREASVTARFSCHPNIINFITHGWEGEEYYLVTEYIQGETLLDRIESAGKLTEMESLKILSQIISAEKYIYNDGYLFRDLKPENVLLEKDSLNAYLFDFGLTLPIFVAEMDQGEFLEASPIYVPPERLTGEGEDITSEIYSLGMILYYAVAGQPYFTTAQEIQGLLKRHMSQFRLSGEVTKLGSLSKDLADVITRMIKREPQDRYPDMESLEADVQVLIDARKN
jgi:serine/threonine-protein kinase